MRAQSSLPVRVGSWNLALRLGVRTRCALPKTETCADTAPSDTNAKRSESLGTRLCIEMKITHHPDTLEDAPCITRPHAHDDISKLHWSGWLRREERWGGEQGLNGKAERRLFRGASHRPLWGSPQCFVNVGL